MARLWQSGFELNAVLNADNEKEWLSASSGQTTVTSPVHGGTYSCKILGSAGSQSLRHAFKTSNDNGPFFARFYLRVDTAPNIANSIVEMTSSTGGGWGGFKLNTDRSLQLFDEDGDIGSPSTALALNTWYMVELKIDQTGGASSHVVEGKLDGSVFATSSTRNLSAGKTRFYVGGWLESEGINAGVWYFDDVAINDSTGSFQTSYPGAGQIIHLKPSSAGDLTEWTPDSGSNFARVNEVLPDDNTSKVSASLISKTDLYNVDDSGIGASDTINVVAVGGRFRNPTADATTSFKFELEKTSGGTLAQSAAIIPNSTTWRTNAITDPYNHPLVTYQDPDAANWTKSTLDSMQIGVVTSAIGVFGIELSTIWASVDYTPGEAVASPVNPYGISTPATNIRITNKVVVY